MTTHLNLQLTVHTDNKKTMQPGKKRQNQAAFSFI